MQQGAGKLFQCVQAVSPINRLHSRDGAHVTAGGGGARRQSLQHEAHTPPHQKPQMLHLSTGFNLKATKRHKRIKSIKRLYIMKPARVCTHILTREYDRKLRRELRDRAVIKIADADRKRNLFSRTHRKTGRWLPSNHL